MIYALILAGGQGVRLWPESRAIRPKPFFFLDGDQTMLGATVARVASWIPPQKILIATTAPLAGEIAELMPHFARANLLIEPESRNTGPAIGYAALEILARDPEGVMVILPSDHFIDPPELFVETLREGVDLVAEEPSRTVIFGVLPTHPATGFGYIRTGAALDSPAALDHHKTATPFEVMSFHEKPDLSTAEAYCHNGGYLWNAGVFVLKARRVLELLREHHPPIADMLDAIEPILYHADAAEQIAEAYSAVESISFDVAVMEKGSNVVVLEAPFAWNDLGTFEALSNAARIAPDEQENRTAGIRTVAVASRGNLVRWNIGGDGRNEPESSPELVALVGVEDLEIIRQGNVLLVAKKGSEALLREVTLRLAEEGLDEFL